MAMWLLSRRSQAKRLLEGQKNTIVSDLNPASYSPLMMDWIQISRNHSGKSFKEFDPRGQNLGDCIRWTRRIYYKDDTKRFLEILNLFEKNLQNKLWLQEKGVNEINYSTLKLMQTRLIYIRDHSDSETIINETLILL